MAVEYTGLFQRFTVSSGIKGADFWSKDSSFKSAPLIPTASTKPFIQLIYSCFSRDQVPTNSVTPSSVYKAYTTHNSSICSDEGLTLETSAFQSLYGGQFTLSTPLINQIFVFHSPTDAAPQFLQKLTPVFSKLGLSVAAYMLRHLM